MEEILEGLNKAQLEAVTSTEGFVRVIAGAGSGKTRALTHRFAYLVTELGVLPGNILCVTFTNKAANEMRQRIHQLTGDNDTGYINTFHGFCVNILQEDSHAIGYPKSFMVLDNSDIDEMLKIIYEERGLTLRDKTFASARDMFEMRKCLTEPGYFLDMIALPIDELHEKYLQATEVNDILFYGYLYQERKTFAVDYNDLIILSLYIFQEHPDIAEKWQKRLMYIQIDEFQDIDPLQYRLMEVLCAYHHNLFIVGDPDQTIYTWRGANVKYLEHEIFRATKAREFVALIEKYATIYAERTISEVLTSILHESGYEKLLRTEGAQDRLDNLAELKQAVFSFETSAGEETDLEAYLKSVAMLSNMDIADSHDRVKLMTVHTAKGLEFPYVFLCSMSEGIFPSKKVNTLEGMEEERRLAFVAITRGF